MVQSLTLNHPQDAQNLGQKIQAIEPNHLSPSDLNWLEKHYTILAPEPTLKFLKEHPFLLPILQEAPEQIIRYFPQDTRLLLRIDIDPESAGEDAPELVLLIASNIEPDLSVDLLLKIDQNWWRETELKTQSKMFINLGYQ